MCKSPKNSSGIYQKPDSTSSNSTLSPSYETLNTNCTVVGSNNLHLLKKHHQQTIQQPQQVQIQVQSPVYSNASPVGGMVFPPPTSPYTGGGGTMSPAPAHKSSPSPGLSVKSPQPTQAQVLTSPQQNYSVMQIIHNPMIGRPIQTAQPPQQQNIIKLKPHLNILPKPASIQQVPRSSVSPHQQLLTIPTTTTLPTHHHHQPTILSQSPNQPQPIIINQMPTHAMLTAAGQLQFILRPAHQTTTAQQHIQQHIQQQQQHVPVSSITSAASIGTKQLGQLSQQQLNSLIQLQQLQQQQQLATLQLPPPPPPPPPLRNNAQTQQVIQQVQLQAAGGAQQAGQQMVRLMTNGLTSGGVVQGIMQQQGQTGTTYVTTQNHIQHPVNISPKKKPKKKKQKLDLANIMKLSGIGDDDDVQFESDTSQSEGEPNGHSQSNTPQPQISVVQSSQSGQPTVVNTATSAAAAAAAVQAAAVQAAAFHQQQQQQQLVQNQLLQPTTLATLLQTLQQQQQVQAQQVQAAQKQQLGNIQIPTVQTAAPNIVQVLSNQSFTTSPSGLVTPTNAPHILSIPTSSHLAPHLTHQGNTTPTATFAPFNLTATQTASASPSTQSSGSVTGISGSQQQGFTLNGATAATLQRAAAGALGAANGTGNAGTTTTTLPVPVAGLGGFKLALGEDGRLVLQHDPNLQQAQQVQQQQQQQQQDLQSQLLLQTIFGLSGGGLLLQPTTIDQQVHSQTVQTIQQQQTVQTIQQQTVQSQTVQHHSLQTIQQTIQPQIQAQTVQQTIHHHHHHQVQQQPVAPAQVQQVQPVQQTQQSGPVQTGTTTTMQLVQPQTIQQLIQQQQQAQQQTIQLQQQQSQSQVVNSIAVSPAPSLSPVQQQSQQQVQHQQHQQHHQQVVNSIAPLPQPIGNGGHSHHHQPVLKVQPFQKSQPAHPTPTTQPSQPTQPPPTSYVVNLTPDQLEQLKRNGQLTVNGQTIFMQRAPAQLNTSTTQTTTSTNTSTTTSATASIGAGLVDHKLLGGQNIVQAAGVGPHQQQILHGGQMKVAPKTIKRKGGGNKILGNKDLSTSGVHTHQTHPAPPLHTQVISPVAPTKGITGSSNIDKVINTVVREAAKSAALMQNSANNVSCSSTGVHKIQHQIAPTTNKHIPNKKSTPATNQVRPIIPNTKQPTTKNVPQQNLLPNNSATSQVKQLSNTSPIISNRSLPNLTLNNPQQTKDNQEVVDRLLGQIIEESQQQKTSTPSAKSVTTTKAATNTTTTSSTAAVQVGTGSVVGSCVKTVSSGQVSQNQPPGQRVHTIQLTPQQQQYLKSIQVQIQALSARLGQQPGGNGDVEVQNALKVLFHEQQKILASGKLLPPDKVFYHNNQIIVNTGSSTGPTVLSTSGLTVLQPPPGKGIDALGINMIGQQVSVAKADVGTSTNGCGPSANKGVQGIQQQVQASPVGSTTAINHHSIKNITKTIQQTSQNHSHTSPDSSTSNPLPTPTKLPSLPSLHPLPQQTISIPAATSVNSQPQQQTLVVTSSVTPNHSEISQPSPSKVPRPILPRLPQQQINKQQITNQVCANSENVATMLVPTLVNNQSANSQNHLVSHNNVVGSISTQINQQTNQHQKISATVIGVNQQSNQLGLKQLQPVSVQHVVEPVKPPPLTGYVKTQRIEQQLTSDQSGAVNPDIQTPFKDKSDACKRLLRYHCYDQPVLSEKDLTKADEIFELTARHFIDKFGRMVDKYRYLLLKEGQRHVQTSELMMLDRMFLSEEQQSLFKLRQDIEQGNFDSLLETNQKENLQPESSNHNNKQQNQESSSTSINIDNHERKEDENYVDLVDKDTEIADNENDSVVGSLNELSDDELDEIDELDKDGEEYDEWQCIQRELGCLTATATSPSSNNRNSVATATTNTNIKLLQTNTNSNSSNCSNSSSTSSSSCFSSSSSFGKRLSNNTDNYESQKRYKLSNSSKKHLDDTNDHMLTNNQQMATYGGQFNSTGSFTNSVANSTTNTTNNTEEMDNSGSIDEQVQSAIDSILNLQQTSGIATSHSKNDADRLGIS